MPRHSARALRFVGNAEDNVRAGVLAAFDLQAAAEEIGQSARDRKSEAEAGELPANGAVHLLERLVEPLDVLLGHAEAAVDNIELHAPLRADLLQLHYDVAPRRRELDRVVQQILHDPPRFGGIPDAGQLRGGVDFDCDLLIFYQRCVAIDARVEQLADVERLGCEGDLARVERAQEQHIVNELQQLARVLVNTLENLLLLIGELAEQLVEEDRNEADDDAQRRTQLVRDIGEKLRLDVLELHLRLPALQCAANQRENVIDVERFGDVVERAESQSFDRGIHRAVAGDDDRFDVGVALLDFLQYLRAGHSRHFEIQRHEVDRNLIEHRDRLGGLLNGVDVVIRLENDFEGFPRADFIVDYEDIGAFFHSALYWSKRYAMEE